MRFCLRLSFRIRTFFLNQAQWKPLFKKIFHSLFTRVFKIIAYSEKKSQMILENEIPQNEAISILDFANGT